jgi:hypothetical protein
MVERARLASSGGSRRPGCEPDIADCRRIAGDDLALIGRAITLIGRTIVDDPIFRIMLYRRSSG